MTNLVELAPNEKRCSKCKEVKDSGEFNKDKTHKDGARSQCRVCTDKRNYDYRTKLRLASDDGCIECPECKIPFSNLFSHGSIVHKWVKSDLARYGIANFMSQKAHADLSLSMLKKPKISIRKGDYAEVKKSTIRFPKKYWNPQCKFAKVKVDMDKLQVHFNPVNSKLPNTKSVSYPNESNHRAIIWLHHQIKSQMDIFVPIFNLRDRAGFYIEFDEKDIELLKPFEFWAKSGMCMSNIAPLTISITVNRVYFSVANHLWPINAEYCYLEWVKPKRSNAQSYLDILPVSRTGFIVGSNKLDFKQYIGLDNCFKLTPHGQRLRGYASTFLKNNDLTIGDWDLKEILPSGALRFVLSEPKAMPAAKQPALKKPDREPQPLYTPEGTFDDWLTEIGESDSQPKEQREDIAT